MLLNYVYQAIIQLLPLYGRRVSWPQFLIVVGAVVRLFFVLVLISSLRSFSPPSIFLVVAGVAVRISLVLLPRLLGAFLVVFGVMVAIPALVPIVSVTPISSVILVATPTTRTSKVFFDGAFHFVAIRGGIKKVDVVIHGSIALCVSLLNVYTVVKLCF